MAGGTSATPGYSLARIPCLPPLQKSGGMRRIMELSVSLLLRRGINAIPKRFISPGRRPPLAHWLGQVPIECSLVGRGTSYIGGIVVATSTFAPESEREYILRHSDTSVLLLQDSFLKHNYLTELVNAHQECM